MRKGIVSFKICYTGTVKRYEIDLNANWTFSHEAKLLAKFQKLTVVNIIK